MAYSVNLYDKDSDIYVELLETETMDKAVEYSKVICKIIANEELSLTRLNNSGGWFEPIDNVVIAENGKNLKAVWNDKYNDIIVTDIETR